MRAVPALHDNVAVFRTEQLPVGDGHVMQVQHAGRDGGIPVLLLHGGPGSGQSPMLRRCFDPQRFHLIAPDQRGAGGSTPAGNIQHNTTAHLLADLQLLHRHLGQPRWLVAGGSWGATLALAHAADQPQAVAALLLRATFLGRPEDVAAFFARPTAGAPRRESAWLALAQAAGLDPVRGDSRSLPGRLATLLAATPSPDNGADDGRPHAAAGESASARAVARAWWCWEQWQAGTATADMALPEGADLDAQVRRYRIQSHYMANGCWLNPPLLDRLHTLPQVPTLLLHADNDGVCPPAGAALLWHRLPQGRLQWISGGGHHPAHPAMAEAQRAALDHYARHGQWPSTP